MQPPLQRLLLDPSTAGGLVVVVAPAVVVLEAVAVAAAVAAVVAAPVLAAAEVLVGAVALATDVAVAVVAVGAERVALAAEDAVAEGLGHQLELG